MRLWTVPNLLGWLALGLALPSSERAIESAVPSESDTCRAPVSPFDYLAKNRHHYELPVCHINERDDGMGLEIDASPAVGTTHISSLFARQVVSGDDYSCGPDRPCANNACCPKATLQCNYGEEYCGTSGISPNEVCWSNCDAKAECGKNAAVPGQECPLNVCCGKWGFCGMTEDFCNKEDNGATGGCQSNCDQPGPKNKASTQDKVIGYYEAWRHDSKCQGMGLDDIPVKSLTHLYFSFASITPGDFSIIGMDGLPSSLFTKFTNLKKKNAQLKTIIAIGGWTFNDPGPTQKVFSDMVSTRANRKTFIDNLLGFLRQYAFDGVDFDWEYPGAKDRGGVDADGANFVTFLKELDEENKKQPVKYVVSFTAPTSFWYLRHFDLKAVDYIDFLNVMSYDLHGVWDRDNPIGSHIYGHTNLTEMKLAFDLFWRNDVPAKKVNMGLGFYGRAFQLADPACSKPGCIFKGGATKGGCSGESGILSYREIQEIIKRHKLNPVHDKTAGVKYITWNSDQWVSFDDDDTFEQKKDMAKDLGLGGYLIWAIDQDDEHLSALQAVISPKKLGDYGVGEESEKWKGSNEKCYVTPCKDHCKPGDIKIKSQKCNKDGDKSELCCPLSGAPNPKECHWRGNTPWCNGHCHDDEVMMEMNKWGGSENDKCSDGNKAFCCKSPLAEENKCYWAGVGANCNGDDLPLTFSGSVLTILDDVAKVVLAVVGRAVPIAALAGRVLVEVLDQLDLDTDKRYCCPAGDIEKWTNCEWYGKPGSCFDGHCPDMKFVQLTDSYFGGGETCGAQLSRVRTFCCEPKEDPLFLPVPLQNLFENPPDGEGVDTDFTLETDKSSDSDQNPNDAAFQFVVLTSPEELQVSLDKRDGSHWDVFGCTDSVSEGEHTVQMVCTDFSENSNCHKIGLGHGVPGTILQMPKGCGPGKYAVAKAMMPAKKNLLPRHLSHLVSRTPVVYDITFDYDFSRVPRDLGATQMRVDFSNQDDYWNTVVAAAATKKKKMKRSLEDVNGNHVLWLEDEFRDDLHFGALSKRDLEERWFGSDILSWLARMVKPEIKREFTHKYEDSVTAKIVDESWSCKRGDTSYEGHILAQALLKIDIESSFGFTLIVTKLDLPLDLSQSYLTFYNKGEITGVLTLEAVAKVYYEKSNVILNIPFPGASFKIPGIATIGPQLTVEGSIDASLAVAGTVETKLQIASWEVRQVVPDNGDDEYKPKEIGEGDPKLDQTGDFGGIEKPEFFAGAHVVGDITARLSAAAEFGIRFADKWNVDPASAAVVGETSVMVRMGAGISTKDTCPFTYGLDVGARLYARVKAPKIFKWPGAEYDITPKWNKAIIEGGTCPQLGPMPSKRGVNTLDPLLNATLFNDFTIEASSEAMQEKHSLKKRAGVYGPAFSIPVGKYFCPSSSEDDGTGSGCDEVKLETEECWGDECDGVDQNLKIRGIDESAARNHLLEHTHMLEKRGSKDIKLCDMATRFAYPSSGDDAVGKNRIYGFAKPDNCSEFEFGTPLNARATDGKYDSEHILEAQMINQFFDYLDGRMGKFTHPNPNEKDSKGNRKQIGFCELVKLQWSHDVTIPNLDSSKGTGATLAPIDHIASQFPGTTWKVEEYVLLQRAINSPAKNNAWGLDKGRIYNTDKWDSSTAVGARKIVKRLRFLLGSRIYHSDTAIAKILRDQKERVGEVIKRLDETIIPNNPPAPAGSWDAWKSQGLGKEWDAYAKGKFLLAKAKTKGYFIDYLGDLKQQHSNDAVRKAAEDQPNDTALAREAKKKTRALADDIEKLSDAWTRLPAWKSPFS